MMNLQSNFGGLLDSGRRVWFTISSMAKNRAELAMIELEEEKARLTSVAIWGALFVVCTFMALIAVTGTVLFAFWEYKLYVAGGLLAFCLIAALVAFFLLKRGLKSPMPFAETIAQFKKDRAWLRSQN